MFRKALGRRAGKRAQSAVVVLLASAAGLAMAALPSVGDGILIPERPDAPNFAVRYHRVEVRVTEQVATTSIDQVFENRTNREQEAVYVFPLPHGAAVREFVLYDEGHPLTAELLKREKAREIYEGIVRKRKDPALLEYVGRDTYRVSMFPIPPNGTKRVQMEYTELLNYDGGGVTYAYPLGTEKFSSAPIEEVRVNIKIESRVPIRAVYSPTHDMRIDKPDQHTAFASLEEHGTRPALDLVLHYTVSQEDLGTSLLTYKEPGEDGFFLFLAAPAPPAAEKELRPKQVVFVLDRSGSMSGEKIEQARRALLFFLNSLNRQDRFRLITFSDEVRVHGNSRKLTPASGKNLRAAKQFAREISAAGGTDIHSALKTALATDFGQGSATYLVFLTDGQPTVGETNVEAIVKHVNQWNQARPQRLARLFVFGVGYDVNTHLLEKLAQGNGGATEYVRPAEDLEVKVSRFFAKVAQPVLTEVAFEVEGVETYDIFPREMPDIFAGSQLLVFGRYRTPADVVASISLTAYASPKRKELLNSFRFPAAHQQHPYVAPLWAARKIGWLLDEIMLHGEQQELVDEIISLSTRYGILTEYTAFLAEEGGRIGAAEARGRAAANVSTAYANVAGAWATSQRQNAQLLSSQSNLQMQNVQYDAGGNLMRFEQVQTRNNQAFFNRAGNWEDARYRQGVQNVVPVKAYSEAYFQLSRRAPSLNQYLSLGERVLLVVNGQAVQIGEEGKEVFSEAELDALLGGASST